MRVVLINPASNITRQNRIYGSFIRPVLPLGIAYIAAALERNNIKVFILDQFATKMNNEEVLREISNIGPQIVGFSCLTSVMKEVESLARQLRSRGIKVVLGNIHATVFADELLRSRVCDFVVRGEGECALVEICKSVSNGRDFHEIKGVSFAQNGTVHHNSDREPLISLDDLSYPAWHLFNLRYYTQFPLIAIYDLILPIQASRGCHYRCSFCSQDKMHKSFRHRQVHSLIDEIEYLHNKFRVKYFGFVDAYFPFSIDYGLNFCEEFCRRGLHKKMKWITESRVDLVNYQLLKSMKDAGLYLIMYGFESGNQKILSSMNKSTTLEQARRAMEITKHLEVLSLGLFILGMPSETIQSCRDTIEFAKRLDCDIAKFNLAIPFPGSKFFEDYKDEFGGVVAPEKFNSWYDWLANSNDIIYAPKAIGKKKLVNLQREAMFKFYFRPKLIARHILRRTISLRNLFYGAYILINKYIKIYFNI